MKGIHYLINEQGTRTAVVVDLQTYGEAIEDFLDKVEAEIRCDEPTEEFELVVDRILTNTINIRLCVLDNLYSVYLFC